MNYDDVPENIIMRVRGGDNEAFVSLSSEASQIIRCAVKHCCRNRSFDDDLKQEALLILWTLCIKKQFTRGFWKYFKSVLYWKFPQCLAMWHNIIYVPKIRGKDSIALNDKKRALQKVFSLSAPGKDSKTFEDRLPSGYDWRAICEAVDERQYVRAMIRKLPRLEATVIYKRFKQNLTIGQVAHALKKNHGTIRQLEDAALEKLRARIGGNVVSFGHYGQGIDRRTTRRGRQTQRLVAAGLCCRCHKPTNANVTLCPSCKTYRNQIGRESARRCRAKVDE
jgi:hypothetical protein